MIKKIGLSLIGIIMCMGIVLSVPSIEAKAAAANTKTAGADTDSNGDGVSDLGYRYSFIGSDAIITAYQGTETALTIPLTITIGTAGNNGAAAGTVFNVVEIADSAIAAKAGITSVTIPDPGAGNKASSSTPAAGTATIPGISTIGNAAFASCPMLTSVTISNTVTSIGDSAFGDCPSLSTITVNAGNQQYMTYEGVLYQYIGSGTGVGTYKLIQYPVGKTDKTFSVPTIIANRLTLIGPSAFAGSQALESITLPDKISGIMANAFQGCEKLTSINIPALVTCIPDYCFEGCTALKTPIISDSVNNICPYAFANCASLDINQLPSSLTTIGNSAFYNCDSLTEITIPGRVTSIGSQSFAGCDRLAKLTAPVSLASVGSGAFVGDPLTIYCHGGSHIYQYATSNRISTVPTFTVNFYSDTNTLLKSEEVVYGSAATAPETGARPGYKMIWSSPFNPVTSDLNIYASYTRAYTVTFIDKYCNRTEAVQVDERQSAQAPKWTLSGYSLSWSDTFSYITSDKIVYAQWKDPKTGFVITEDVKFPLPKGSYFENGKARYKVRTDDIQAPTVTYVYPVSDANEETVKVPSTVKYQDVTYKVVTIAENAFKGNDKITQVKIGTNIKYIKPSAFENCKNLEKIIIYSKKITKIYYDAFAGIKTKATFRVYASKKKSYTNYLKKSGMTVKYRVLEI